MKVKFWKHTKEFHFYITIIIVSLIVPIWEIIDIIKNNSFPVFIIFYSLYLFVTFIYMLFIDKRITSKVVFSMEGIEVKYFKKQIVYIRWEDILEAKETVRNVRFSWLSFVTENNQINIDLTKKIYNIIMLMCPREDIKRNINNIEYFKWYHRKSSSK